MVLCFYPEKEFLSVERVKTTAHLDYLICVHDEAGFPPCILLTQSRTGEKIITIKLHLTSALKKIGFIHVSNQI